jgi:hypothetical protein
VLTLTVTELYVQYLILYYTKQSYTAAITSPIGLQYCSVLQFIVTPMRHTASRLQSQNATADAAASTAVTAVAVTAVAVGVYCQQLPQQRNNQQRVLVVLLLLHYSASYSSSG